MTPGRLEPREVSVSPLLRASLLRALLERALHRIGSFDPTKIEADSKLRHEIREALK